MPVEDVVKAIEHSKKELEIYSNRATWYETSTRYAIIDPILWALGWRTHRSLECEVELPIGKKLVRWVDYALLDPKAVIVVLIEAKPIKDALSNKDVTQIAWYARNAQIRNGVAVLTNGIEWRLYNLDKRGSFETKLVDSVNLLEDAPERVATFLFEWLSKNRWWMESSGNGGPSCPSDW